MLTPERKRSLIVLGIFLVPVALVKGTSLFYGVGAPAGAVAALAVVENIDMQITAAKAHVWTEEQQAAAAYVAELYELPFEATPLYYSTAVSSSDDGDTKQPIDPSLSELNVQTIMVASTGATALINGGTYCVGDMFQETAWKIIAIDNDTRTVTLENQKTSKIVEASVRIERFKARN